MVLTSVIKRICTTDAEFITKRTKMKLKLSLIALLSVKKTDLKLIKKHLSDVFLGVWFYT